jgi:Arylsulfotransferase (ASST)
LRALDPARTSPGLTLFTPSPGDGSVWLINANGKPVHSWRLPYPGQYAYITEQGTLFFNGKIPGETFIAKAPFGCGVALEADWNGRILWEVRNPNHHHDGRLLKNGNVILLCAAELPEDVAARVKGGMPGTEVSGRMWADYLVEVTKEGRTVWEWRTWEHLDPAEYPILLVQNLRAEWTHGNSVIELIGRQLADQLPEHLDGDKNRPELWPRSLEIGNTYAVRPACARGTAQRQYSNLRQRSHAFGSNVSFFQGDRGRSGDQ